MFGKRVNRHAGLVVFVCIALATCVISAFAFLPRVLKLASAPIHVPPALGEYWVGDLPCNHQIHVVYGEFASVVNGWGTFVVPSDADYPDLRLRPHGEPVPGIVGMQRAGEWWYGACQIQLTDATTHMFYFVIDPRTCKIPRFETVILAAEYLQSEAGVSWAALDEPWMFADPE